MEPYRSTGGAVSRLALLTVPRDWSVVEPTALGRETLARVEGAAWESRQMAGELVHAMRVACENSPEARAAMVPHFKLYLVDHLRRESCPYCELRVVLAHRRSRPA